LTLVGASRGRLIRQLVIESPVLSPCGGLAGVALAYWATQALVALAAGALTAGTAESVRLDGMSVLFALGVSTMTAILFCLGPARQAGGVSPQIAPARAESQRWGRSTPDAHHAVLLRGLLATLVFGVTPGDPVTYSIAALVFLGVALISVAIPALRGSRAEPVSALRWE
jgi:ABC-type antimicrobial peptide transport system permease subunit